jgi:hypothetical protein
MLDRFLASLPKMVVALGAILIGFALMVMYDPPRTICDAQMELFRESQKSFLYTKASDGPISKQSRIHELHDLCMGDNSPGGCFEYFEGLKKLAADLNNIPNECAEKAGAEAEIETWLWKSLKIMALIAWGERAPASYTDKLAWFDSSEVVLFCELKKSASRIYGVERLDKWREELFTGLPEAEQLNREQLWQKSILSTSCDAYR